MSTKTHFTTCKVGACEPQCGMIFSVDNNRIVDARPDPDHPISKGYVCKKGMAIAQYQHDPDRLLYPEKKIGADFARVPWEQATQEIGAKLREICDRWGPSSIATYWGNSADSSGIVMANSLCAAFGSPNSFNVLSLEYTDRGAVAQRMFHNEHLILQPDADNAEFALLLGTNPLVTQGMTLLQRRPRIGESLKGIQRRGGKVVVVDPRVTESAKIADQHLSIRPGTDLFLLLGMLKHIVSGQFYDHDYVRQHTSGMQCWETILADITLSRMGEITGIAGKVIEQLAQEFARARTGFITTRVGVQTSHNTTLTEWLVQTLNAITGNIARQGGLYYHPGAINNIEFVHKFTKDKNDSNSRIGDFPQLFGGPPASVLAQDVLSEDPERIRALLVIAGNPVISFPNTEKVERALKKLDLLVCIDIYRSDTGSFADYNLPAATIYEKGGLHFLTQPFEPYPNVEWRQKILEPEGEARPEWDVVRDICRSSKVSFLNNRWIDRLDKCLGLMGSGFSEEHLAQFLLLSGMSQKKILLKKLKRARGGIKTGDPVYSDFFDRFIQSPGQKIQLAPADFVAELKSACAAPPMPTAQFPLLLISGGRRLSAFNSWTHNMADLSKNLQGNHAVIHWQDAKSYGIDDGEFIQITAESGVLRIPVKISDTIREGVILVHQFWGHCYNSSQVIARETPGYNVNHLHSDSALDHFTGMPIFNGTRCAISLCGEDRQSDVTARPRVTEPEAE